MSGTDVPYCLTLYIVRCYLVVLCTQDEISRAVWAPRGCTAIGLLYCGTASQYHAIQVVLTRASAVQHQVPVVAGYFKYNHGGEPFPDEIDDVGTLSAYALSGTEIA
eukprot:1787392-Rhodomonas_salina.2